ncbi:MAG TPA: hypothetical protein PKX76_06465, partial [Flexilinea sp.]|nr:hypothetical protein [Flexilinea sp.]
MNRELISEEAKSQQRKRNFQYSAVGRLFRNPSGVIGLILVIIFIVIAVFSDYLMPYDPIKNYPKERLQAPSSEHLAGT